MYYTRLLSQIPIEESNETALKLIVYISWLPYMHEK